MSGRLKRWIGLWLVVLLTGCGLEGGALAPSPSPGDTAPPSEATTPASASNHWFFGITEEPANLYPYGTNSRTIMPLVELLYPAPLAVVNETYTTTGVLERVPTFENGDVAYVTTTVFLDPLGAITTTQTEVVSSVEQLTVTYHWNQALRWSDGTPVTAKDSVFAYQLYRQGSVAAQLAAQRDLTFDYVAIDEHTTRAFLPPAHHDPNYLLTVWRPLPSHLFSATTTAQEANERLAREPLGYGAYALADWKPGFELNFTRTEAAAANLPDAITVQLYPDVVTLKQALQSKAISVGWTEQLPEDEQASIQTAVQAGELQRFLEPTPVWEHLDFNLAVVALQDIRMRRAIAYGFNRDAVSTALYGTNEAVWHSWIAPSSWAYAPDRLTRYDYDPAQANTLLDEMGYLDTDGNGLRETPETEPFSLTLLTSDQTPVRQALATQFQSDMRAIGLDIVVQNLPTQELYSQQGPLFHRDFQLAMFGWLRDFDPDGAVLWSCAAIPNEINGYSGDNFTGWCMDTADTAIRAANTTQERAERLTPYAEHQEIFTRELPVLPILDRQMIILAQPGITGIQPEPLAPLTWNLQRWSR